MLDAVTSGAISMDMRTLVSRLARKDEKIKIKGIRFVPGGSAANIAVALAHLGKRVGCLGKVGNDEFGAELIRGLEDQNVTPFVSVADERTGVAIVVITPDGEKAIYVLSGANALLSMEDVNPECMDARFFIQTGVSGASFETAKDNLRRAKKNGVTTCFSPSLYMLKRPAIIDFLKNTEILILNRSEATTLSDEKDIRITFNKVSKLGPRNIVITLGAKGAVGWFNGEIISSPAFKVKAVDTTGAGDTFTAGLISAYLDGADPISMLKYGCANAALKIRYEGTRQTHKKEEVDLFLKKSQ